jgi:hypothetical protein
VLENDDAGHSRNEERAKGRNPTTPEKSDGRREDKGYHRGEPVNIAILPDDQGILLQIRYIVVGRRRIEFKQEPPDMGVEESLGDAIRIVFVVNVFMVTAMFARPEKHRVLKCRGAKNQCEEPHQPMRLKGPMREKSVVPDRDRKSAGKKHYEKQDDLERIQAEKPEVGRDCSDRQKQSTDQERTDQPIDFLEWDP